MSGIYAQAMDLKQNFEKLPFVMFYRYLWRKNKLLLFKTLFVNYVFGLLLELLPLWYFSRRKLGRKLRTARIKINHNMVTGRPFSWNLMKDFLIKTVLFAALDSLHRYLKDRIALENKFVVKRLVLERILYAEPLYFSVNMPDSNLATKLMTGVSQTLHFFNTYLPSLFQASYALILEGSVLYQKRHAIDRLALFYPLLIGLVQRAVSYWQYTYVTKKQKKRSKAHASKMDSTINTALVGIQDIQLNNLQGAQLDHFDKIAAQEIINKQGIMRWFNKTVQTWNTSMSVFAYALEVYFVHVIMKRQNMNYREFAKIQQEIDHVVSVGTKAFQLTRRCKHILEHQSEVAQLLNVPNFIHEIDHPDPNQQKPAVLESVKIRSLRFAYPLVTQPTLSIYSPITLNAGKKYAITGKNKAGKSTLCKVLTNLYPPENPKSIMLNDIPFANISRQHIHKMIAYVSQKPFVFPGTVRQNIRVGNPSATSKEVYFAARCAGLFDFDQKISLPKNLSSHDFNFLLSNSDMTTSPKQKKKKRRKKKKKNKKKKPKRESVVKGLHSSSSMQFRTVSYGEFADIVDPNYKGDFYNVSAKKDYLDDSDLEDEEDFFGSESDESPLLSDMEGTDDEDMPNDIGGDFLGGIDYNQLQGGEEEVNEQEEQFLEEQIGPHIYETSPALAQQIALARLFLREGSQMIILDEALSGIDHFRLRNIFPQIVRLAESQNSALVVITHNPWIIKQMDHIIILDNGNVAVQGKFGEVSRTEKYNQLFGYS